MINTRANIASLLELSVRSKATKAGHRPSTHGRAPKGVKKAFDEAKHPRDPLGSHTGGHFKSTGGATKPKVSTPRAGTTKGVKGSRVSDAINTKNIKNKAEKAELERVLKLVDSVHGGREDPIFLVEAKVSIPRGKKKKVGAYFHGVSNGGAPDQLIINPNVTWAESMTDIHEIGHYIDFRVIGRTGSFQSDPNVMGGGLLGLGDFFHAETHSKEAMANPGFRKAVEKRARLDAATKAWKDAVHASPEYKHNESLWSGLERDPALEDYALYLNMDAELWARAYAQYMAIKTGDKKLLADLETMRENKRVRFQWSDENFKPIYAAVENVLKEAGLM